MTLEYLHYFSADDTDAEKKREGNAYARTSNVQERLIGHSGRSCIRIALMPISTELLPAADTGSRLLDRLSALAIFAVHVERRFDPFFRPAFDKLFRASLSSAVTALINMGRTNEGLKARAGKAPAG